MTGTRTTWKSVGAILVLGAAAIVVIGLCATPAQAVVKIFDGFGDADRDNNGVVEPFDTDMNLNGSIDDPTADAGLIARGIHEVKTATDTHDVGIMWSGIRGYDSAANDPKSNIKIINDDVAIGSEPSAAIFHHGLALGVESKGGSGGFIGKFGQTISVGPQAGDKVVVSVDFRTWLEATNPNAAAGNPNTDLLRWGLVQDTDNQFGSTAAVGSGWFASPLPHAGATVTWGKDDGNWYGTSPGPEGDKAIFTESPFGSLNSSVNSRIKWEYNKAGINGTANDGRILEGAGVSDTSGLGGDVGTIANPSASNGPGAVIPVETGTNNVYPHKLSMEISRLANGLLHVATFVDNVDILHDDIKTDDTGYAVLSPPADSYNYVAFRNTTGDFDFVIDNFQVEVIGSNAGSIAGDYNGDNKVDAADYTVWRDTLGSITDLRANGNTTGASATVIDIDDYNVWKANFGMGTGSGGGGIGGGTVPEPGSLLLGLLAAAAIVVVRSRRL